MVKLTQPSELNSTDLADLSVLVYITILQIQWSAKDFPKVVKDTFGVKMRDLINAFTSRENCSIKLANIYTTTYNKGEMNLQHSQWTQENLLLRIHLHALLKLSATNELLLHKEFPVLLYLFCYLCKV